MFRKASGRHGIRLVVLVAETSLWANPEVHRRLIAENGVGAFYPNMRRYRAGLGEQRRQMVGTECLDDNTYANNAIKKAIGVRRRDIVNFDACHIWPQSCYDSRCHTVIANLVLLPRPLAGLSDHDPETQAALQFRSYELYKWCPEEQRPPRRPAGYPSNWREPMPFSETLERMLTKRNGTR